MTSNFSGDTAGRTDSPAWRNVVSLLLFAHLFFVFVALGSNYARSGLTDSLLNRFAVYCRLFNFDLDFTPYHLTHGTDADVDHRIEVLPQNVEDWTVLPSSGFPGSDSYKRYQRFAAIWAYHSANEGEPAVFAQAVGNHFSRQRDISPRQIRCRKHFQQPREDLAGGTAAQRDPNDPMRFAVAYAANAIVNSDGSVDVVRVEETGQVAVPVNSAGGARGNNANERGR
jgi:hypothetical protein